MLTLKEVERTVARCIEAAFERDPNKRRALELLQDMPEVVYCAREAGVDVDTLIANALARRGMR